MEESPFIGLPAELRNRIYEATLTHDEPIFVEHSGATPETKFQIDTVACHPLALAQTCRQARSESLKLFYACNTFVFLLWPSRVKSCTDLPLASTEHVLAPLKRFGEAIGPDNLPAITSIIVDLCQREKFPYGYCTRAAWLKSILVELEASALVASGVPLSLMFSFYRTPYKDIKVHARFDTGWLHLRRTLLENEEKVVRGIEATAGQLQAVFSRNFITQWREEVFGERLNSTPAVESVTTSLST